MSAPKSLKLSVYGASKNKTKLRRVQSARSTLLSTFVRYALSMTIKEKRRACFIVKGVEFVELAVGKTSFIVTIAGAV